MKPEITKPLFRKDVREEAIFREICKTVNNYLENNPVNNRPLVLKFGLYFGLFIVSYLLVYFIPYTPILYTTYIAIGLLHVLLGLNFAHDFAHNAIFKSKKLNNTAFEFLFALMGINGYLWKKRHTHSHHNYPNTEGYDVDIELGAIIYLSENGRPQKHHKWQYIYGPLLYSIYTLYWIFYKDFVLFIRKQHANLRFKQHEKKEHIKLWVFKLLYVGYMLILPAVFSPFTVGQVLEAFVIAHFISAWFLLFTFLITHHVENTQYFHAEENALSSTSWLMHQVGSSNDFHPFSKVANFIFGGFNCHIAHHLFPNVCHTQYPLVSKVVYTILERHQIVPNKTSFFGGIHSHVRLLKKLGNVVD
ncbi:MAG TPA: fatty acid desaturase [Bacteroidia bacterium]|nr:fatty acid desaturase [Bacteroidia bacterium]